MSLERRTKLYGHYNKRNVISEIKRLSDSYRAASAEKQQSDELCFLKGLESFLSENDARKSSALIWIQLTRDFSLLKAKASDMDRKCRSNDPDAKLWHQLAGIYNKVQQLEIRQQLSGVFSSEGRIVLYMNNIEAICKDEDLEMDEYLQSVLVHEYTHACHYGAFMEWQQKFTSKKFSLEKSMLRWSGAHFSISKTSCVKETLARYMQAVWCRENSADLSDRLFSDDYGEYVIAPNWPYAGAQMLLNLSKQEAEPLFNRIWQTSLIDWEQAYKLLSPNFIHVK